MKVQCLTLNLIKALSSIKESNTIICNVTLPRQTILEILKINKDENVTTLESGLTYDDNDKVTPSLRVLIGRNTMTLYHHSIYDNKCPIPAIIDFTFTKEKTGTPLDTRELLKALTYAIDCADKHDYSRPELNGVLFVTNGQELTLVGADGYRLAQAKIQSNLFPDKVLLDYQELSKKLLPFLKGIQPIGKGKDKFYPEVYVDYQEKVIRFSTDKGSIELDRLPYTFPDYQKLLTEKEFTEIKVIASELLDAINTANVSAREASGIVRLEFGMDTVKVSAKAEEIGTTETHCDCQVAWHIGECKIALNAAYLKDTLKQFKGELITLELVDEKTMIVFKSSNRLTAIMPMEVTWDDSEKGDTESQSIEAVEPERELAGVA